VGGCVHVEVREGDVPRVAFDGVEHIWGVLLAEARHFDIATAGDVEQCWTIIAAIGGKKIVSIVLFSSCFKRSDAPYAFCPLPSMTPDPVKDRSFNPLILLILIIAVLPPQYSVEPLNLSRPST
jgi:hypothetical protein